MDSREWWARSYSRPIEVTAIAAPSDFAIELNATLPPRCRILDLGCGPAYDSTYFSQAGHHVVAADFVRLDSAWSEARRSTGTSPCFVLLDMRAPLPLVDAAFDVVYARLSLHYFPNEVTSHIFGEIHRVLAAGGVFAFLCKSTNDPRCGQGEEVGPDMFRVNDKTYHFFSEAFARQMLGNGFQIERIWSGPAEPYGEPSNVVSVWARKAKPRPSTPASNIT